MWHYNIYTCVCVCACICECGWVGGSQSNIKEAPKAPELWTILLSWSGVCTFPDPFSTGTWSFEAELLFFSCCEYTATTLSLIPWGLSRNSFLGCRSKVKKLNHRHDLVWPSELLDLGGVVFQFGATAAWDLPFPHAQAHTCNDIPFVLDVCLCCLGHGVVSLTGRDIRSGSSGSA